MIARILQRDRVIQAGIDNQARWAGDDGVAILLDPFQDHRNAFLFATNPNGAEFDALVTDESASYNADWRGVWRVAARRTPGGVVGGVRDPVPQPPLPLERGEPALGLQRRAVHPPQERGDPVERLVAGGGRTPPGEPRRPPGGPRLPASLPPQPRGQALRARGRERGAPGRRDRPPGDERLRRGRPQVGGALGPRARRHREPGLRPGGGRRPDRQPDAVRPLPAREAGVLPRERRGVRVRDPGLLRAAARSCSSSPARSGSRRTRGRCR